MNIGRFFVQYRWWSNRIQKHILYWLVPKIIHRFYMYAFIHFPRCYICRARNHIQTQTQTHIHWDIHTNALTHARNHRHICTYVYIYIYICMSAEKRLYRQIFARLHEQWLELSLHLLLLRARRNLYKVLYIQTYHIRINASDRRCDE